MPTLFKTTCSSDWKCRPSHALEVVGTGTKAELLKLMDADVLVWQVADIAADQEGEDLEAAEEKRESHQVPQVWANDERWEMDRAEDEFLRVFAGHDGEWSDRWSIAYHIVE